MTHLIAMNSICMGWMLLLLFPGVHETSLANYHARSSAGIDIKSGTSLIQSNCEFHEEFDFVDGVRVGDPLESLRQGVHTSKQAGTYKGGGDYEIFMDDGGRGPDFWMRFRLTAFGGGVFELKRTDCNDPPTTLYDKGSGVLKGDAYTLNFGD